MRLEMLLHVFVSVVVVATFLLVSYMVFLPYETAVVKESSNSRASLPPVNFKKPRSTAKRTGKDAQRKIKQYLPLMNNQASSANLTKCSRRHCVEFLSSEDFIRLAHCYKLAKNASQERDVKIKEGACDFVDQTHRDPVALISYPGSGNTWVRQLLESATGKCTGAVYCDISLRMSGFVGEYIRGGSVLVTKTHKSTPIWVQTGQFTPLGDCEGEYGSAILIVRNPFDALVAEWNRKVANEFYTRTVKLDSHTRRAGEEWFGTNKKWDEFVHTQILRWKNTVENWLIFNHHHPVMTVRYEDLKVQTNLEVARMLNFLRMSYDQEKLDKKLTEDFNAFHRLHYHKETFDHFTERQRSVIVKALKDVDHLLGTHQKTHLLNVTQYYE